MNTIVKSFADLDAEQKIAAVEMYTDREKDSSDNFFSEGVVEYYRETVLPEYGINGTDATIHWSGFWSQGDGASISTDSVDAEKFLRKIKALTKYRSIRHLLNEDDLAMSVERSHSRYAHENTVSGYIETAYTDLTVKQAALADDLENVLTETIRELSCELYRELEKAYDDYYSTESMVNQIEGNGYQFEVNEDGDVVGIEY